jgi:hypothetical protein
VRPRRGPARLALEHGELRPEGEDLHLELETGPNGRSERGGSATSGAVMLPRTLSVSAGNCKDHKRYRIPGRDKPPASVMRLTLPFA